MRSLLIFGAGGHGKVVAETARAIGNWQEIAFADDGHPKVKSVSDYPVIADFPGAGSLSKTYPDAVVAIGDNRKRLQLTMQLFELGFSLVTLVHPAAVIAKSARIEKGAVIFALAVVQPDSRIGLAAIINTAATVDHDCLIGRGVHLSPGVRLGGEVTIGERSWLGVGVAVVNKVNIGHDVVIGAGAAVVDDIPDHVVAVGVPAREKGGMDKPVS